MAEEEAIYEVGYGKWGKLFSYLRLEESRKSRLLEQTAPQKTPFPWAFRSVTTSEKKLLNKLAGNTVCKSEGQ